MPILISAIKWGVTLAGGFALFGVGANQTGQAVDTASNGLVKIALAGGAIYFVGKKLKWL